MVTPASAEEVYEHAVKSLPPSEQLEARHMTLNDIPPSVRRRLQRPVERGGPAISSSYVPIRGRELWGGGWRWRQVTLQLLTSLVSLA